MAVEEGPVKRSGLVALALLCALVLTSGCSATGHPSGAVRATVTGGTGTLFVGDGGAVTFAGLPARATVHETISSRDAHGLSWQVSTKTKADAHGKVIVDDASYGAMTSTHAGATALYAWGTGPQAFTLEVAGKRITVQRQLERRRVTATPVTVHGLVGTFYDAHLLGRHPAVLMFGGSEGGQPGGLVARALAGNGFPVLTLAYFKAPGLPQTLAHIPLEYFNTALSWLTTQPDVEPRRVFLDGASRGGELALLLGTIYPHLIHGVFAAVPSDAVICGYPDCSQPAWTLAGRPVPFTRDFGNPYPQDDPRALIPVQRIAGPVLLSCGGQDQVWPSCTYTQAIVTGRHGLATELKACADCDHYAGDFTPGEPGNFQSGNVDADEQAAQPYFAARLKLLQQA